MWLIVGAIFAVVTACKERNNTDSNEKFLSSATVNGQIDPITKSLSYNFVRREVFKAPLTTLPYRPGLSVLDLTKLFFLTLGDLATRSARTFVDEVDFKDDGPKWLHPDGVCAEMQWTIESPSKATGLFAAGTKVPGIIRFSSGTNDTLYVPNKAARIFGLAIKLFPTQDADQAVITSNIQTLDNNGFERATRKSFFNADPGSKENVYYTNVAPAHSAVGITLAKFFDRFDRPNFVRPVYASARFDANGVAVPFPMVPYEVRFIPRVATKRDIPADFRDEIRGYGAGEIKFDIGMYHAGDQRFEKLGEIVVGKPMVSDVCDLSLHFHHNPSENQRERHLNGNSVEAFSGNYIQ